MRPRSVEPPREDPPHGPQAITESQPGPATPQDFLTCAPLLDACQRIKGYKLAWSRARREDDEGENSLERLRALLSCAAAHLHPPRTGWRLGPLVFFFDMTAEGLMLGELHALPPANVVLCLTLEVLTCASCRPMLMLLHRKGFGFMLCGALALPDEPELRVILTHVDVAGGCPKVVETMSCGRAPARLPMQPVATHLMAWHEFNACAARGIDVMVRGFGNTLAGQVASGTLQPETLLIVRLMQMIRRDFDLRSIEATLKHDAALCWRLLAHINSPGVGIGVEIHSLRQAIAIFGFAPLFRWMAVLLATSNKAVPDFMTKQAIVRGRFVELMGEGLVPSHEADDLFLVGMFSLMDRLLGVPMLEVLDRIPLSEAVRLALLRREGPYGGFITLAESCESDACKAALLAESMWISVQKVNAAHLTALAWAQDVAWA